MKKLVIAFTILALILGGWAAENYALGCVCESMTGKIDRIIADLEAEDYEGAKIHTDDFYDSWHKSEEWITVLTPHTEVDEISRNSAKLRVFSTFDGCDEAIVTAADTRELLMEIHRKTHVNLMNVF